MALNNKIIKEILQDIKASESKILDQFKDGLNNKREGNIYSHSLTGETMNSIKSKNPIYDGVNVKWEFESNKTAGWVNKGTPISAGGTQYYNNVTNWVLARGWTSDPKKARKMAGAVIAKHQQNKSSVKNSGWLDERQNEINEAIALSIENAIFTRTEALINKNLNKKIK